MTDEFFTLGLQNDRYLKALRLVDQFENEIEAMLREFGQRMVDEHSELFDTASSPGLKHNRTPSSALATHRVNYPMIGAQDPDSDRTPKLNIHLYWMAPTEYGRTDIQGALRAFGYKIKYANKEVDDWVAEQTRAGDWDLHTSENPFDSNTTFYRHVSSEAEIEEAEETLLDHFSRFGGEYAVTHEK